jgi:hypothetical protein
VVGRLWWREAPEERNDSTKDKLKTLTIDEQGLSTRRAVAHDSPTARRV